MKLYVFLIPFAHSSHSILTQGMIYLSNNY